MEYQKLLLGETPYFVSCVPASYPTHCHNEIELMYCMRGRARIIIEGETYPLEAGSILFISSLAMHQTIVEGDDVSILVLEFGSQFLGAEFQSIATQKFSKCLIQPTDPCDYRNRLEKPLKRIYKEFITPTKGSHWAIQGFLFEIFAMIVRYVPMEPQSAQKIKSLDKYLKIEKVFDLVQNEYHQDITLERAASYVGYDLRAFCRLVSNHHFKWWFDFSPQKGYLTYAPKRRVSQALLLAASKKRLLHYLLFLILPTALEYTF